MAGEQGRDISRPGRGRQHVRWGGRQVHLLAAAAPEAEAEQLHGLARRDDCGAARRLLQGRSLADIRQLVDGQNRTGSTPLHVAAYYGSREMINLLMECGAQSGGASGAKNKLGWDARHYAARWSQPLDTKLAVALRPSCPALNSSRFTFTRIRELRKAPPPSSDTDTLDTRKLRLASDSGISVRGSSDSLGV